MKVTELFLGLRQILEYFLLGKDVFHDLFAGRLHPIARIACILLSQQITMNGVLSADGGSVSFQTHTNHNSVISINSFSVRFLGFFR